MIRFSRYFWVYIAISALVLVPGILSLLTSGFRQSVDFTGGTLVEYRFKEQVSGDLFSKAAERAGVAGPGIQQSGDKTYLLRFKPVPDAAIAAFESGLADAKSEILRKETVGPILGKELLSKAITAAVFAIVTILLYVAYAFRDIKFGVSAIVALFHDVLVVFGTFSLLGKFFGVEVDTLFVTAFLTTMSFSVHDTIVIFDRIREYRRRDMRSDLADVSDVALTETMGRSLINSFTIIFMLLALVLMGGQTVKWFAVALLVGTVTGTYSSPFVATPVLVAWDRWEKRHRARKS